MNGKQYEESHLLQSYKQLLLCSLKYFQRLWTTWYKHINAGLVWYNNSAHVTATESTFNLHVVLPEDRWGGIKLPHKPVSSPSSESFERLRKNDISVRKPTCLRVKIKLKLLIWG